MSIKQFNVKSYFSLLFANTLSLASNHRIDEVTSNINIYIEDIFNLIHECNWNIIIAIQFKKWFQLMWMFAMLGHAIKIHSLLDCNIQTIIGFIIVASRAARPIPGIHWTAEQMYIWYHYRHPTWWWNLWHWIVSLSASQMEFSLRSSFEILCPVLYILLSSIRLDVQFPSL